MGGLATAVGAASLAAEQAGLGWAVKLSTPRVDKTFRPRLDRGEAQRLLDQWRVFVEAQAALSRRL